MENRKFLIFIIISLMLHFSIFYFFKIDTPKPKKEKLTYVDILKRSPEKSSSKEKAKPDILSDKNLNLKKKDKDSKHGDKLKKSVKQTNPKVVQKKLPTFKQPIIKEKKQKNVESLSKAKPKIKLPSKNKTSEKKSPVKNEDVKADKKEKSEIKENNNIAITDNDTLRQNILNPKNIINDIANYNGSSSKDGEDSVNFNSMKFKYASYFYKFKKRLYNVWTYPSKSVMNGEEGTVRIKFSILKDGTVTNIKVVSSSGYPDLDKAAIRALKTMGKVPLSDSFGLKRLNVDGYFSYKLGFVGIY